MHCMLCIYTEARGCTNARTHTQTSLPSNTVLLDASKSVDDQDSTEELTYQWEEITGPVGSTFIDGPSNNAVLRLIDLEEGNYKYK